MDSAHFVRTPLRTRASRSGRRFRPASVEALELRALLTASLIKDINPVTLSPAEISGAGANVYFVARAADGGAALDVRNAIGTTVLKEFPLNYGGEPSVLQLTAVGNRLYFVVAAGSDEQLWMTDGTGAGTKQVALPPSVATDDSIAELTAVGSALYFTVETDPNVGPELYRTDGTASGTRAVSVPAATSGSWKSGVRDLVNDAGTLYFLDAGRLMTARGTAAKAVTTPVPSGSKPAGVVLSHLTNADGLLYFTAEDFPSSTVLYVSNGTAKGTHELKEFSPGKGAFLVVLDGFTAVGRRLFFSVGDGLGRSDGSGLSLWMSNGTAKGTTLVKSLPPEPYIFTDSDGVEHNAPQSIYNPTAVGNRLFFMTQSPGASPSSEVLWVSNGTTAGTVRLANIDPAQGLDDLNYDHQFAALGTKFVFANNDPAHGMELWVSDGTVTGTHLFRDLDPGPAGAFPGNMSVVSHSLYFSAIDSNEVSGLWATRSTTASTRELASLAGQPTADGLGPMDQPGSFAVIGDRMVFAADDGANGTELWATDGTPGGTVPIKRLTTYNRRYNPLDFTTVGNRAFFVNEGPKANTLWVTDGTSAGTHMVTVLSGMLSQPVAFGNKLAFIETGSGSFALWESDGTAMGTTKIKNFKDSFYTGGYYPSTMAAFDGKLFLTAPDPANAATALWVSDGTGSGTRLFSSPKAGNVDALAVRGSQLYFSVDATTPQLWLTDGTTPGTHLVASLGTAGSQIQNLVSAGPKMYVVAYSGDLSSNEDVYKTDGTAKGTVLVHRFANAAAPWGTGMQGIPIGFAIGLPNGRLIVDFQGFIPGQGLEGDTVWLSDGTTAGTRQVQGVTMSPTLNAAALAVIDGRLYFQGTDAEHGSELWQSDGTVAGTTLLADINVQGSSYPIALTALNGRLIIAANDGLHGEELMSVPIPEAEK